MRQRAFILLLFAVPAFAADTSTASSSGISTTSYIQALLALLLIVGVLAGTAWLARKVSSGKMFGQGGLQVIGGVALGPRERLVLVEVGDTWLVIGIVPGQIRTLHRLPKGESPPGSGSGSSSAAFANWLKTVGERRNDHDQ